MLLVLAWLASHALQQPSQLPPRDRRTIVTGRGTIAGVVVAGDERAAPLRRARVRLTSPELVMGQTVITNDDGTFAFDHLPPGRYTVNAAKDAYPLMYFGSRRAGHAGRPIVLGDGETRRITLRVPRGGVIAGTVTDAEGQPAPGAPVQAYEIRMPTVSGQRTFAQSIQVTTDDLGGYRLYGLPPGEYVVVARPPMLPGDVGAQMVSATELRRALADSRQPPPRSRPGFGNAPNETGPVAPVEPRRSFGNAPVFYPGTLFSAQASTITIRAGEVRTGVDFAMDPARTATLSGNVFTPAGLSPPGAVLLQPTDDLAAVFGPRAARPDQSGNFVFTAVPPGRYRAVAYGLRVGGAGPQYPGLVPQSWASSDITVDGEDVTTLQLTMRPAVRIPGRVVFEGSHTPALSNAFVTSLPAAAPIGGYDMQPVLAVDAEWRFELTAVPGRYRLFNAVRGQRSALAGWWLKSIAIAGRELLDSEIDIPDTADNATVVFSDAASELTGVVTVPRGAAVSDYKVIVFGTAKTSWFFNSRRIAAATPDAAGRYSIRNLPPGEYLVVVTDDVDDNEWFDPAWLAAAAPAGTRVKIAGVETKRLDLVTK